MAISQPLVLLFSADVLYTQGTKLMMSGNAFEVHRMSDDARKPQARLLARISLVITRENENPDLRTVMDQLAVPFDVTAPSFDDLRILVMHAIDEEMTARGVPTSDEIKA